MLRRKTGFSRRLYGIVSMLSLVLPAVASSSRASDLVKLRLQPQVVLLHAAAPWRTLDFVAGAPVPGATEIGDATAQASSPVASSDSADATPRISFAFNHKTHAALHLECAFCHQGSVTADHAGFPAQQTCMACHQQIAKGNPAIAKLAGFPPDARVVPEKPVYLLPDFVNFSHSRHHAAAIDCTFCHGDVWQMETVEPHLAMRMKACVDCHRTKQAPVACNTCHEAFQQ
jgi:Cytochrome c7 and related cytochrome c